MSKKPTYDELKQQIVELEKIEKAFSESEKRYQRLAENSPDMLFCISLPDGNYEYVSPASEPIFGYPPGIWYANPLLIKEIIHPEFDAYFIEQWENLINGVLPPVYEYKIIHKEKGERWINQRNFLVINEHGQHVALEGIATDITERKTAEELLYQSENKLRATLDATPFPVAVVDLNDDKISYWSSSALDLFGHTAPTTTEWYQIAYPDPDYRQDVIERWKTFLEIAQTSGRPVNTGEYRITCKDGSERICELYSTVLTDNRIVTFNDITERKLAGQERLANIHFLDSMDRINRAIQGTNNLEQMMSNVLDEVISIFNCDRAFLINIIEPDLGSWIMPIARWRPEYPISYSKKPLPLDSLASKVVKAMFDSNEPVKAGPGTPFPLTKYISESFDFKSFMGMALYPKTGKLWELGIHQCSHERIFTTEEERLFKEIAIRLTDALTSFLMYRTLSESEEEYRTMMESFIEPLYISSHDYKIEYMNPAMIRRTGRDATGEKCYHALHGLDAKCDWCVLDKVLQGDKLETNIRSPLDDRQYRISIMAIQNRDGTISKMAIYRDITNFLLAVSEKEKAQAQLIQAQKMESIGKLAGGIAHDFNNILSSIIGFTDLALGSVENGTELEDDLQEVKTAGMRAKDLVKQILTFARQSDEKIKPIQMSVIVKEVLKFIKSSIPSTIQVKGDINSDSFIMGSPTQVHQILMNLCTNASQAMEAKGGILDVSLNDVTIKGTAATPKLKHGNYIKLTVKDTGMGISPQDIASIFDPYFTTKDIGEGTGMGLAVVHGIVESYGGKITVDSTINKGTCFCVYLPISKKRKIYPCSGEMTLPSGNEHILFIDDEVAIAKMGNRVLEQLGYTVTSRTSSIEALELFRLKPEGFDLVITDMTMPNMTGDKLAAELMQIRPGIPVILCTGYNKKISEKTAAEMGIKAFVYKPMEKAVLAGTIRKVLDEMKISDKE